MKAKLRSAFTLLETVVSVAVLGAGTAAAIAALLQMNYLAALSRLKTGAGTAAQNQIDAILSIQPYNPQYNQIPPQLAFGSTLTGSPQNPTVPIYTDPVTGNVVVSGWIVTNITDTGQSVNGVSLNLRQATVTVFYIFRNQTHQVQMTTLRGSDI